MLIYYRLTHNLKVVGSNPTPATNLLNSLGLISPSFPLTCFVLPGLKQGVLGINPESVLKYLGLRHWPGPAWPSTLVRVFGTWQALSFLRQSLHPEFGPVTL